MMHGSELRFVEQRHIDENGHLNNTFGFGAFFEEARDRVLQQNGFDYGGLKERGLAIHMSESSYRFVDQVFLGDDVYIDTNFEYSKGARVFCNQEMFKRGQLVSSSNSTYFFANSETGKPTRPPKDLVEKLRGK